MGKGTNIYTHSHLRLICQLSSPAAPSGSPRGVLTGTLRTDEEFVPVSEVEMNSLDGREMTAQFVYTNKANTLFARETEDDQTRGLGDQVGHKPYSFVGRSSTAVRLYIPFYTLTGQMHYAKGKCVSDVLNSGLRFLPLTNVKICPRLAARNQRTASG